MRIAEIFRSIQGEGRLTGTESIFVRTSGCNLRCRYCDTPYASWTPEGEDLSVAEILARVDDLRQSPPPAFLGQLCQTSPGRRSLDRRRAARRSHRRRADALRRADPAVGQPSRRGLAHHDRDLRHALPAGGVRSDVDQPEAVELHAAARAGPAVDLASHAQSARAGGDPPADGRVRLPNEVRDRPARGLPRSRGVPGGVSPRSSGAG